MTEQEDVTKTLVKTASNTSDESDDFRLELYFQRQNYSINGDKLPFSVGRDKSCDIIVHNELVSRVHCLFELREGQVGIYDKSTNGTFVMTGRSENVRVKNTFYPLVGHGYIKLGDQIDLDDPDLMLFKVVRIPK